MSTNFLHTYDKHVFKPRESVSKQSVIKTFKRKPFFMYIYVKTKKKK